MGKETYQAQIREKNMESIMFRKSILERVRSKIAAVLMDWAYSICQDECVQFCFDIAGDSGYCDDCDPGERFGRCR